MDDKGNIKIDELGKKVKKVSGTVTKESKKMQSAWAKSANAIKSNVLGIASMATAVFAIRGAVKTVLAFEDAMAEVSTIVDTSTVDMKKLNAEILDLSTRVPKDAESLAQGLYQTISAGVTDVADAMIVLESSSKAATAGLTSTFVAVDAGTTIMNAYGKTVEDIDAIQDVLFNTVKEGKTKYDSLATSIGRAAPIAAQVGVKFEELTAAAATLTKGGLSTEEAMTSIRAIMVGILKPTADAEQLAKKLKIQFDAEALAAKGLGGFLEEVKEKTGGNAQAITGLFGNVRALTGVMSLAGKQADEFKRIIESNTTAAGVMNEAFEKVNTTVTNQWQLFKNQFNKTLLETSEKVLPAVTGALKGLNEAISEQGIIGSLTDFFIQGGAVSRAIKQLRMESELLKIEMEEADVVLKPFVVDITTLGTVSAASSTNLVVITKDLEAVKAALEDADTPFRAILEHFRGIEEAAKAKLTIPDPPSIVPELTADQKTILKIKEAILKAEKESMLTQMAVNQIEAERIANAQAAFPQASEIRAEILSNSEAVRISQDGIVDGMREWADEAKLLPTLANDYELAVNAATGSIEIVVAGTRQINENYQETVVRLREAVSTSRNWEISTLGVLRTLSSMARQMREISSLNIKSGLLSGLGKLAGLGVAIFNPALGAQIIAGSGIAEGLGFQHGGEFRVGGSGGADSQLVTFRASPGERVQITPPGQSDQGSVVISPQFNITGASFSKAEASEIARPGMELIAESFKRAIAGRKIRRSDIEKAV
ncbi:MAG TPA: phage tail tape measure protein [Pricia antarctica]|uniref:Phage tail tape measure protein n=2 Tax=root TaxID=1 RepID=A0A831VME3_9FLAO|nr:phage tail tape measure protein [Pricia antarctica]